jgi:SAM-dependent methyltransferase
VEQLPDHVAENRRYWDAYAPQWVAAGERQWRQSEPTWGIWGVPESTLAMLPASMQGLDAVELGCGTGYVSAWMARRGARVMAIDNSREQLATAQRLAAEHSLAIEFLHGNAEATPYPDASFDFAISEYGAAIWCDPERWIPEAWRILRPGGRLVFLGHHPWTQVYAAADGASVASTPQRSYFELRSLDWRRAEFEPGGVEFNLPISGWFELFARVGFSVEGYAEPRPEPGPDETRFGVSRSSARETPSEQVWRLRKP